MGLKYYLSYLLSPWVRLHTTAYNGGTRRRMEVICLPIVEITAQQLGWNLQIAGLTTQTTHLSNMGKIIFYEDKNFGGRHFECSNDCEDMLTLFDHCNSIRVESGFFMIYEQPRFSGHQYYLSPGEYPDYNRWMGLSDTINSYRLIPMEANSGTFKLRAYQRTEFGGQMIELEEDCPSVMDSFHIHHIFSCNVASGNWLFYEKPNFQGRMYLVRPGTYQRFSEWGARSAQVGSIKCIKETKL